MPPPTQVYVLMKYTYILPSLYTYSIFSTVRANFLLTFIEEVVSLTEASAGQLGCWEMLSSALTDPGSAHRVPLTRSALSVLSQPFSWVTAEFHTYTQLPSAAQLNIPSRHLLEPWTQLSPPAPSP